MSVNLSASIYGELPKAFKEELKTLDVSAEKYVKQFIAEAVGDGLESKHLYALKHKPLMLDPNPKIKIKKRSRATGLSAKEKRELGLFKIPKEKQEYGNFIPLHKLWMDYMKDLLGLTHQPKTLKVIENKLLKADYHGAILKVTQSSCCTYVNIIGIVVKETKNMFYLATEDNKIKGVPKCNSSFEFQLDGYVFEIFGNNFRFRPGERSAKKFKTKTFMTL